MHACSVEGSKHETTERQVADVWVWYVFYNHTAFKGGTTQKLDRYEYLYLSCHIVVGVRKASQLVFVYTTDAIRYVQTEDDDTCRHNSKMLWATWEESANIMLVRMSLLAAIMKSAKPLVLSISYQLIKALRKPE